MDPTDDSAEGGAPPSTREDVPALDEAALVAADEPLTILHLVELSSAASATVVETTLHELADEYARLGSAFQLVELADGYQLMTRPEFHPWLVRLGRG